MQTYSFTDAKAKFSEMAAKAMAGEEILLTRQGKPALRVSAYVPESKPCNRIGFMKTPYFIADDFDEFPEEIARAFGMIE